MKKAIAISTLLVATLPFLTAAPAVAKDSTLCQPKTYEMALRYQQKSAEIMALQLQTYKFAADSFRNIMASYKGDKKPAIMLDLDETVIDNSKLLVRDMQNCHDYTKWDTWGDWEKHGNPVLIPGAKAFLDYVNSKGVAIFYVSDRFPKNKADTLKTLKSLELPQATSDHTMLDTKPKEQRRQDIAKTYNIIMQFGDSLPDFAGKFKNKKSTEYQRGLVEQSAKHFGTDWIVLPNASYGSWSNAKLDAWKKQ